MKNNKLVYAIIALMLFVISLTAVIDASEAYGVYYSKVKKELPIYSVKTDEKKIAISFDCAWGVEHTDNLLEVMKKYNVRCTFFTVQFWAEKYPDYIRKIDENGHEIGTHSATHSHMSKMSEADILSELNSSKAAIEKITNKKVMLFRAPFGEYNDTLLKASRGIGLEVIQWDVDSLDWKDLSQQEIAMRIISKVQNGSIILCHNNGLNTDKAMPLVFADLQSKGYEFVPISELLIKENYKIDENGRQYACS